MVDMARTQVEARPGHAKGDIRDEVATYTGFHDVGGGDVTARREGYTEMVSGYYDLVTDFYEQGWGESFHFAPRYRGEAFPVSIARHQHYLAARLGITKSMKVMDIGCGVGGPMREIARFTGAHITGINNNGYQVAKAQRYNRERRLDHLCNLLEADFMEIPRPNNSVDAIYAFEATCHAPDKTALFKELVRVLKPGGKIAVYEWCLTDSFDPENKVHADCKQGIEIGNGLPDIWTLAETKECFETAGFKVLDVQDRAGEGDPDVPWHNELAGRELSRVSLGRTPLGRRAGWALIKALEALTIAPKGTMKVSKFLHYGADALVVGGDTGCFTPMAFFLAQKPRR